MNLVGKAKSDVARFAPTYVFTQILQRCLCSF
jgi:hypothetical protein